MFSEVYRTMNERIVPSPALRAETLSRVRRRPFPRRIVLIAAVLAVCLATPALAAQTEPGYRLLYAVSPAAAQFFQPVQISCTDSGITMEVVSVSVEGDTARVYVSLTGEAVDSTCDLYDSWDFRLPFDQTGTCEQVDYDSAAHTAVFLCTTRTMDGSPIPRGGKMTFSLREVLSGKEAFESPEVDLPLADRAAGTADDVVRTGGSGDWEDADLLAPGDAPLAEPVEGLPITAMGYVDGLFHIQVEEENKLETDSHCRLWLEAADGTRLDPLGSASFLTDNGQRRDYTEFLFDTAPNAPADCTLHGDFYTAACLTRGNWRVTFPLVNEP